MRTSSAPSGRFVSPERLEAVRASGTDLCVSAGAGSGKTSLLVDRFMHAVTEKGIAPSRILAITFTEKAAKEMKSRLIGECLRLGLTDIRRELENAYIHTIHGLCSRMLRENPIESRVDPAFTVLGEGESELLAEKVLDALFEEEAANDAWISMLCDYDEASVRAALADFYDRYRASGEQTALSKLRSSKADRDACAQLARSALERLDSGFQGELSEAEQGLRSAGRRCSEFISRGLSSWAEVREFFILWDKGLHKKCRPHASAAEEAKGTLKRWMAVEIERFSEPLKKEFGRLFLRFKERYEQEKRQRAACDFEDLLLVAHGLVAGQQAPNRKVRSQYQALFKMILVDEVQDTNPLQYRLIELLRSGGNLFLVGDAQQSIYGFRHAEPRIFSAFLAGKSGNTKSVTLPENFRSRSEILGFINGFFKHRSGRFQTLLPKKTFSFEKPFSVEIACIVRNEENDLDLTVARVKEAALVADRLREMFDLGFQVEGENGRPRPLRYRDIAILFRGMTNAYLYEKELAERGIPCAVAKGRTFYSRPEVMDLLNFLKIVEDPHDDIALAAVLRSPMVQASDDALFWLARAAKSADADAPLSGALKKLRDVPELSESDREKMARFNAIYDAFAANKNRTRISVMMHDILANTDYEAKALARPDGRQRQANVLKLLDMAERMEEKGVVAFEDFIGVLKNLSERESTEPEAAVPGEPEDAVLLSTIHGVKGLEFPCVVIADMGAVTQKHQRAAFLFDDTLGFGLRVKDPVSREWMTDALHGRIRESLDAKEREEEERLFYVAMTRAKEHLLLAGSMKASSNGKKSEDEPWMTSVCRVIGFKEEEKSLDFEGSAVRTLSRGSLRPSQPSVPVAKNAKDGGTPSELLLDLKNRLRPVTKIYSETEDMTVTTAVSLDSPRMAFHEKTAERDIEDSAEPRLAANEYGTIYHRWMEAMVLKRGRPGASFVSRITQDLNAKEKKEMALGVQRFWTGPWGMAVKKAPKRYAELPFIYRTPLGILKGQIDLVFKTSSGEWVVLDYKTHRISAEELPKTAAEYELQIGLYALVFGKLYGEAPARGVLYFSSLDRWQEFRYTDADLKRMERDLERLFLKAVAG